MRTETLKPKGERFLRELSCRDAWMQRQNSYLCARPYSSSNTSLCRLIRLVTDATDKLLSLKQNSAYENENRKMQNPPLPADFACTEFVEVLLWAGEES